ncbi:integrase catalytic domain-containing protein [Trichonephila clavipes]|uniref:Integrase catalytic domain-containing protein n=1 Tax=Trichonephila clavipes TaxID=2585209 RepID=A0A8X7B9F3_TRICX|nr:integrase catalytic domain-containing protein [Trichonephila clavipes]
MPSCHSVQDLELSVQDLWFHLPQDNIRCLINSMSDRVAACIAAGEPGSKAERLVLSFPATAANYPKAIDQLKEKFRREDLLVQIYVRHLLTFVMKNAATGRAKADLPLVYDELESKLRSLESLGKTHDKTVDELPSARGERRGDGSFGTDRPHSPPESTKKDYHATQVNKVETTTTASLVNMDNPGISSPTDIAKKKTLNCFSLNDFNSKRKIIPDGSEGRIVYRHCRVVFGVSSSPFQLNASIMNLLENCQPQHEEVAQKLKCSFYVDNCVSGVFNTDEQGRFIEPAKLIMLNGCFNLRGFVGNVAGKNVDRSSGDTSVLGVIWNLETDTLKFCTDMDTLTRGTKITKRLILAIVQKIFDPIGLLTPATLLPKLLILHLWKMKIAWDSELSANDVNVFLKWFRDLYILKDVTFSRCKIINSTSELHVFLGASKEAYAACVFVRSMFKPDVKGILVRAKARVAPLKPLSIPCLELMACCIGSRLANYIVNALNLPNLRITFWSNSTTALWWIKEKGNWSVFVENRVKEIRQLTRGHLWKHVPGNLNIADLLSHGCSPRQMLISRWWEGPLWLRESPEYWPLGETHGESEEVELERKN